MAGYHPDQPLADRPRTILGCWSSPAPRVTTRRGARSGSLDLSWRLGGLVLAAACVNVLDAAGRPSRCASARLRAAPCDWTARRKGIVGQCIVEALLLSGAAAIAGTAVAWLSRDALRALHPLRPQSDGRARSPARRPRSWRPPPASRWVCALGVCAAAGAAGQPRRSGDGVPGRHGDARQPAPVVGGARPARRAGGAVAGAAGQRRPVLADAQPARCRRRRLRSARPAPVPRRRHVGRLPDRSRTSRCTIASASQLASLPGVREVTSSRVPLLARTRQNKSFQLPGIAPRQDDNRPVNTNGIAPLTLPRWRLPVAARPRLHRRGSRGQPRKWRSSTRRSRDSVRRRRSNRPPDRLRWSSVGRRRRVVGVARDAKYTDLRRVTCRRPSTCRPTSESRVRPPSRCAPPGIPRR